MVQLPQEFLTRMQDMLGDEFDAPAVNYIDDQEDGAGRLYYKKS